MFAADLSLVCPCVNLRWWLSDTDLNCWMMSSWFMVAGPWIACVESKSCNKIMQERGDPQLHWWIHHPIFLNSIYTYSFRMTVNQHLWWFKSNRFARLAFPAVLFCVAGWFCVLSSLPPQNVLHNRPIRDHCTERSLRVNAIMQRCRQLVCSAHMDQQVLSVTSFPLPISLTALYLFLLSVAHPYQP